MNSSYPSFLSENANRAFPFVVNPLSSGIDNSWLLSIKGFSRKSLLDNINLYKIFVYPESFNQLTGEFLNDENINLQNYGYIQPGYVSLIFEVHKGLSLMDRTVSIKIPISNSEWPYSAVASRSDLGIKDYEIKCLVSEKFFEDLPLDNLHSIESVLYLEPSTIYYIANVVVDKLSIIDPNKTQQTENILVQSNDGLIKGLYVLSGLFNGRSQYFGPNDFCLRWKTDGSSRWSLSKKTTSVADYYFSSENTLNPEYVLSWSVGTNGTQFNNITLSRQIITLERNVRDEVKFFSGINTGVSQSNSEITFNSTLSYGLGQGVYTGSDPGVCNGIININGVRPANSRTIILKGSSGVIIENRPDDHTIVIKINPEHPAAKCPPFLKVTNATLSTEYLNPNIPDLASYFAVFKVVLTSEWSSLVVVNYETVGDTAISNTHFQDVSGSINLSPGEKFKEIKVPIFFENFPTNQELKFFLDIQSTSGVYISNASGEASFKRPISISI